MAQRRSLSAVLADLAARRLAQLDEPIVLRTDERSGFLVRTGEGAAAARRVLLAVHALPACGFWPDPLSYATADLPVCAATGR